MAGSAISFQIFMKGSSICLPKRGKTPGEWTVLHRFVDRLPTRGV